MKKYILLLILTYSTSLMAQTVLLEQKVDSVYTKAKFGVNSTHFVHMYLGFGFVFGMPDEEITRFFFTNDYKVGLRYKLRINNTFSTGADVEFNSRNISFPTHNNVKTEKYVIHDLKYDWFLRLNYGKRGDIMGKFIDIGVYGSTNLYSSEFHKIDVDNSQFKTQSYTYENLKYLENFNYGFLFRLGINQFVLFANYRYSDILKPKVDEGIRDIPRCTFGVQMGIHR